MRNVHHFPTVLTAMKWDDDLSGRVITQKQGHHRRFSKDATRREKIHVLCHYTKWVSGEVGLTKLDVL